MAAQDRTQLFDGHRLKGGNRPYPDIPHRPRLALYTRHAMHEVMIACRTAPVYILDLRHMFRLNATNRLIS